MSESIRPNVGADIKRIHAIITRGLNVAVKHSQAFAQDGYPDASTREGFISYVKTFIFMVHSHHLTEDEVAFPFFQGQMPATPFDALTAQHQEMIPLLDRASAAIDAAAAAPEAGASLNDLHDALTKMRDLWHPHIQLEEGHLSPEKADELLSMDEQISLAQKLAQHSQEHSGPDFLAVPFMLYNLSPEDRAVFAQVLPPILTQQLVPGPWKEKWAPMLPFLLD